VHPQRGLGIEAEKESLVNGITIAVTGVSGLVGQVLLPYLERDPEVSRVVGLDLRPLPDEGLSQPLTKLRFHQMDVRNPQAEGLLNGVDTLVHLAFVLFRSRRQKNAELDSINIQGTQGICQAAARQGVRKLVMLSSVMACGLHPDNPIPLTEDMPLRPNPDNFYSRAKALNEEFLDRFAATHPEMVVTRLRACTIVGPHAPPKQMAALFREPLLVVRGCNPPYQLLYEEDAARAIHWVIQRDAPGLYNVAGDEAQTMRQLAQAHGTRTLALPFSLLRGFLGLVWWLGLSPLGTEFADLARYPLVVDTSKLKALGWQPQYTTPQAYAALRAAGRPSYS
jgi:UDP-glucose 4-epimerase